MISNASFQIFEKMEVSGSLPKYDMETDISQIEAPTFTTIDRSNPAPVLALDWDHKVNLVGKKVMNPMIHCCDKCLKPILIYGRMIPCKHVFCLGCAKQEERVCPRCGDKVSRVEQAGLGNIFLCTQGGSRYGNNGCRRTYLSSRDLQAHVAHRHNESKGREVKEKQEVRNPLAGISKASLASVVAAVNSAHNTYSSTGSYGAPSKGYATGGASGQEGMNISVLSAGHSAPPRSATNLITIHAQEAGAVAAPPGPAVAPAPSSNAFTGYPPSTLPSYHYPPATQNYPNLSQPPPAISGQFTGASSSGYGQYQSAPGHPPNHVQAHPPGHSQYQVQPYPGQASAVSGYPATSPSPAGGSYQQQQGPAGGSAPSTASGYQPPASQWNRLAPGGGSQQSGTGYYRR